MKLSEKMRKAWLLSAIILESLAPKRCEILSGATHTMMQMRIMATVINEKDLCRTRRKASLSPLPT